MIIRKPCVITPRLLPGLKIGNAFVSIEYSDLESIDGRTIYCYYIDFEGKEHSSNNSLKSGCNGGDLNKGLSSLLSFLQHSAGLHHAGITDVNFPDWVCEWAYQNDTELQMAQLEIEESKELVIEE